MLIQTVKRPTCLEIIFLAVSTMQQSPLTPLDQSLYDARERNVLTFALLMRFSTPFQPWTLDKATGPVNISAHMLKATAGVIAPSVTALMNLSLQTSTIPKHLQLQLQMIINQSPF